MRVTHLGTCPRRRGCTPPWWAAGDGLYRGLWPDSGAGHVVSADLVTLGSSQPAVNHKNNLLNLNTPNHQQGHWFVFRSTACGACGAEGRGHQ